MAEERRVGMSEVLRGLERIEKWQDKHSGEGQATTHALVEKRLDAHASSLTKLKTGMGFFTALYGFAVAWLVRKL